MKSTKEKIMKKKIVRSLSPYSAEMLEKVLRHNGYLVKKINGVGKIIKIEISK